MRDPPSKGKLHWSRHRNYETAAQVKHYPKTARIVLVVKYLSRASAKIGGFLWFVLDDVPFCRFFDVFGLMCRCNNSGIEICRIVIT
jgi:hypothetical protein